MRLYTGPDKMGRIREGDVRDYKGFKWATIVAKWLRNKERQDAKREIREYKE